MGMADRGITGGTGLGTCTAGIIARALRVGINCAPVAPGPPASAIIIAGSISFLSVHLLGTGLVTSSTGGGSTIGIKPGFCFSLAP
ncbi:hypothetical protein A3B42_02560 [Candidatus Daviesbacteria bacterium RIFCSPLOWO2_01_FULL_38_10]|nr:MAG: hypothetical protein A3D02_02425 [Candidatus Daviesbacteria bacterium RIFCSPHIGHO2_02_FULL_39_41]OGE38624.1 MAG: hypothetical protein A3B42_02560 [Candidatus Daviesbacteria bacterium RIFCSPLOWO2_01_FULL_38_10]HBQ50634.1 hypothetical protein [Candidatus Daviesbacteria bacterium]HCB22799.1 hypothetical protein [Candidatus Daviesbacteria bacterium]